jgi:dTDP-4-amino-4,6-dideoxygalactose transaminase
MRIGRTIPPAAARVRWRDLAPALAGGLLPARARRALAAEIAADLGVEHVFLVSSGTAALTLALQALRTRSRAAEVVIPAYTCFSVPAAVVAAGLRPVPCDIEPTHFDFQPALLDRLVGRDTLCVVAHHLYGVPSDVERVRALCAARGVFVVEDAAQAAGLARGGRRLGAVGDVGILSFGRGKHVTCGSGGAIVTGSAEIATALQAVCESLPEPSAGAIAREILELVLMGVFVRPWLFWLPAALPSLRLGETLYPRTIVRRRLSGFKAALLRGWASRLRRAQQRRAASSARLAARLARPPAAGAAHPYLRLPVLAETRAERDAILARARARGLGIAPGYPASVDRIPELRAAFDLPRCPAAADVADRLLTLPTHDWLSGTDERAVAACLAGGAAAPAAWRKAS